MRDGRPVEPQQVHARVGHYPDLFEKVGTFIKLRDDGRVPARQWVGVSQPPRRSAGRPPD